MLEHQFQIESLYSGYLELTLLYEKEYSQRIETKFQLEDSLLNEFQLSNPELIVKLSEMIEYQ